MKQIAVVTLGSWNKFIVPIEKLSEFLKATSDFRTVDNGWVDNKLVWYYNDILPSIEMVNSDTIMTREEYDALREAEKAREAQAAEEELS